MNSDVIRVKVDEFVKWDRMATDCKRELEILKGEFMKLGREALTDRKNKQAEFWGSNNAKVVVTESETLKVTFPTLLRQVFGDVVMKDYEKEKVTYEYTESFKRILIAIFQGGYVDQGFSDVLRQIPVDEATRKALGKKLKGRWKKDTETLENVGGLGKADAEYYAYQVQESLLYEAITGLLKVAGHEPGTQGFDEALKTVKLAVAVEEGVKVGVEAEEEQRGDMTGV